MASPVAAIQPIRSAVPLPHERLLEFCRKWKVTTLSLYGSIWDKAMGESDEVGVLLDFEPDAGHSLYEWSDMKEELGRLFGRSVEVVTPRSTGMIENPYFRKRVLDGARQIYPA